MSNDEPGRSGVIGTPSAQAGALGSTMAAGTAGGRLGARGQVAVAVVCAAVFLTALDQYVVVTALLPIVNDLGVSITQPDRIAWIISGYLLGYVIAMPLMGRIADVYGRWRVFALCCLLFALGSLTCALAPALGAPLSPDTSSVGGFLLDPFYTLTQTVLGWLGNLGVDVSAPGLDILVAARFLQALGGGALVPVAMAVVGDLFGARRRGLALGLVGALTEAGGVLGPVWGAFVVERWGWQAIFVFNLPLVVLLLVGGFLAVPRGHAKREPIDLVGAVLFGAALLFLTLGLGQQSGNPGALDLNAHASLDPRYFAASGVLLLLFLLVEVRRRFPVIAPALFRSRAFSASAVLSLLVGGALVITLVEIPFFVDAVMGATPIDAGLALLRMTVLIPVGALLGGALANRFGCPPAGVLGALCMAGGLWLMHSWPMNVGWGGVTLATAIAGLGFGLVIAPISTSALNGTPAARAGVASSVVTVLRMAGMIVGLAGLTTYGLARFRALAAAQVAGTTGAPSAAVVSHLTYTVLTEIFGLAAILALVGVIPALLLWRRGEAVDGEAVVTGYVAPLA